MCVCIYMCACVFAEGDCLRTSACARVYVFVCERAYVCMCVQMSLYPYVLACVSLCVCARANV